MARPQINLAVAWRLPENRLPRWFIASGLLMACAGVICLFLAPFIGPSLSDNLWGVEPVGYIGGILMFVGAVIGAGGLAVSAMGLVRAGHGRARRRGNIPVSGVQ